MKQYSSAFDAVFPCKTLDEFRQIKELIEFRTQNPLVYIKDISKRPAGYIHCQHHHIVPRTWFQYNGLDVDNSDANIVLLKPDEHVRIHVLMRDYFKKINDMRMSHAMAHAVGKLAAGFKTKLQKILNDGDYASIMKYYSDNVKAHSEAVSAGWKRYLANETPEQYKARCELKKKIADNETAEHKAARIQKLKDYYKNMSDEERLKRSEEGRRRWENMSSEAKLEIQRKINKKREAMTVELRQAITEKSLRTRIENEARLTDEERANLSMERSNRIKKIWSEYDEEKRKAIIEKSVKNKMDRPEEMKRKTSAKLSVIMSERLKNQIELSNDETHHHTRVDKSKTDLINKMLADGYVIGNHTARWRKEGYVRKFKRQGFYWKP